MILAQVAFSNDTICCAANVGPSIRVIVVCVVRFCIKVSNK